MSKMTLVREGLRLYRGYYIKSVTACVGSGGGRNATLYEVAESLEELEEYIGLPRFTSVSKAQTYIKGITKDNDRVQ